VIYKLNAQFKILSFCEYNFQTANMISGLLLNTFWHPVYRNQCVYFGIKNK